MEEILPNLHRLEDSCNVYVLTDGDRALLIDCGSGAVLDALPALGVKQVDWVLFTHHHRDQCYGAGRLVSHGARLAVPEHERFLFEQASEYWQQKRIYDNYNDRNTFFSVGENLPVSESLVDYENFTWGPYTFFALPTPGHSLGSISLVVEIDGTKVAFTGDLVHDGGKLYQLHALENDYGDLSGANWTAQSLASLNKREIVIALPSHGPVICDPAGCFRQLDERIHRLFALQPDRLKEQFMHEVRMEQLSEHLLWGTRATCSNFYVVRSDSGKALFIDYPYPSVTMFHIALHTPEPFSRLRFIEHHLDELKEDWGVVSFDVVVPTHIHDDHICGVPFLQKHHGTECWALEDVAKVLEAPAEWNTPCLYPDPIRIDRRFRDGQRFEWEGFSFEIVFYPGQTEFHSAILGEIDGKRVLFSGDSTYPMERYNPDREGEWMANGILRNSLTLSMHRKCADEFDRLRGELLCPGHGPVCDIPPEAYAAHREFVEKKEQIYKELLPEPADLGIDLFWARLLPYQHEIEPGGSCRYKLELRNSFGEDCRFLARLGCGTLAVEVTPEAQELALGEGEKGFVEFEVAVPAGSGGENRRHLLTSEISVNGKSHGPVAEAVVRSTGIRPV